MASCYACGITIPAGQEQRKWIPTGRSVGVSFGSRSRSSLCTYHSVRTLCAYCAVQQDTQMHVAVMSWLVMVGILLVVFLSLCSR